MQRPAVNGLGIAAMAIGIGSILLSWIPILGLVGAIMAVIFGHIGLSQINHSQQTQRGKGLAIAGFVLGYVGLLLSLIFLVVNIASPS